MDSVSLATNEESEASKSHEGGVNYGAVNVECDESKTKNPADEDEKRGENGVASGDMKMEKPEDKKPMRYGWFGFSPKCLQILNNVKGYVFILCTLSLVQSMIAFGSLSACLSTIEKRFKLSSFQSSFLFSIYELATLSVALFVTYLGERGHKPRWVGFGSAIFSLGSVTFALPHFLTGLYEPGGGQPGSENMTMCALNATDPVGCDAGGGEDDGLSSYYWVFILAQILHGIGGAPLYSVAITYINENVEAKDFSFCMGLFTASNTAGPAIGQALSGLYLTIYTDFHITDSGSLTPDSPLWIGAWWLGFLVNGGLLLLASFFMLGFPKSLPGSEELVSKRKSEVQRGREFDSGEELKERLKALPRAFLNLLTNIPYLFVCFFMAFQFLTLAAASFGPKYIQFQFNKTASQAALYTAMLALFGVMTGSLLGGGIVTGFKFKFKGVLRFAMFVNTCAVIAACGFLLSCPTRPMAGVTVEYENTSLGLTSDVNITSVCNIECGCGAYYDPVCGSNEVLYYSPCHAGCTRYTEGDEILYEDCSCIDTNPGPEINTADPGECPSSYCSSFVPFMLLIFCLLLSNGMVVPPAWTATIRCVPHSQRSFAVGIQTVIYSALGLFPGPIILGTFIDKSCMLWEEDCDGLRTCWLYDNKDMSLAYFLQVFLANVAGTLCLIGAYFTYKMPTEKESDEKEGEEKESVEGKYTYENAIDKA